MILERFIEHLQKIAKDNPEALGYEVIYSIDEEGNGFDKVFYPPSLVAFDGQEIEDESSFPNAVLIN